MSGESQTRWWWLRHAPIADPEGRIAGRLDLPCDTSETERFQRLARRIPPQAALVESGLIRCTQTVGALEAAGLLLPPAITEPDFVEQDFGRWQGRTWAELQARRDPTLDTFWTSPDSVAPPDGESFVQLTERVSAAIARHSVLHAGRDILAVAHAGTVRAALALALGIAPARALAFVIEPLSLTRLDLIEGSWRVVAVNWPAD